jgi:hypothetical protein
MKDTIATVTKFTQRVNATNGEMEYIYAKSIVKTIIKYLLLNQLIFRYIDLIIHIYGKK